MAGVILPEGGPYSNSATITGSGYGIVSYDAPAQITNTNSGSITAAYGVVVNDGGSVYNYGAISGTAGNGVEVLTATGNVTNHATISASHFGVKLFAGGSVTNTASATISVNGDFSAGVYLTAGGTVTNDAGGTITAQGDDAIGLDGEGASDSFINKGTITGYGIYAGNNGATGDGVCLFGGGSLENDSTGSISGNKYGVYVGQAPGFPTVTAAGSVTNAGSISGGVDSIVFVGAGANTLTLQTGSSLTGDVVGSTTTYGASTTTNTLVLQGTGSASNAFDNFNS